MRSVNGNIRIGEYEFSSENILGKGATGNVYKGTQCVISGKSKLNGDSVAIKAIEMSNVSNEVTKYLL